MKQYDSIEYYGDNWGIPIIAFDKLDGSNLRFEWSPKRGFYKFGTRKMMIDGNHDTFGYAVDLFLNKYNEGLSSIFRSKDYRNIQSFVCYAELVGPASVFGQHYDPIDKMDIVLFDISMYKKSWCPPRQFCKDFSHLGIPKVVYEGNLNTDLVKRVKENEFDLSEGVICKGYVKSRKKDRENLYYCKIKTNDWLDRLRTFDPKLYDEEMKQARTVGLDLVLPS
jgi:hypothetical protein